jgi:hypothetical protein
MIKCNMNDEKNEWFFCYWDEPEFNKKELKQINNKKPNKNESKSNTSRSKTSN